MEFKTKVERNLSEPNITIPAGSTGKLLDVIIENVADLRRNNYEM